MSEQEPNPEYIQKNLADDCSGCGERYLLESSTVNRAYWFSESPHHSFAQCQCPNCEYKTIIFIDDFGREALTQHGVEIEEKITKPPQNVIDIRKQVDAQHNGEADLKESEKEPEEYEEVPTFELTPRMEKLVSHFGEILRNCPDDLLYDSIVTDSPDNNLPQRWI